MKKALTLFCVLSASIALASTLFPEKAKCPIDGEKFEFYSQVSASIMGMMLDAKPYGGVIAPSPIAKCPKDGMVLYKKFSAKEIATLKPFVKSKEYQSLQKSETNHWLAYLLSKRLSAPTMTQIAMMQAATWEAADDDKQPGRYEKYARELIQTIDSLQKPSVDLNLLKGELYRRIKEFDKASQLFSELKKTIDAESVYHRIISQQIEWIEKNDSSPQRIQ